MQPASPDAKVLLAGVAPPLTPAILCIYKGPGITDGNSEDICQAVMDLWPELARGSL